MSRLSDPVRLAVGTLTVLPTRPPQVVDRRVGSWAMTLAPAVGAVLAVPAGLLLWLLGWGPDGRGPLLEPLHARASELVVAPLLAAALTVGLLALLTRAMHLDGLADTVDGLGSGRPAAGALEIMRRGDVGPFGVVALSLVLLVQVLALGELVASGHGQAALLLALVASRLALPLACTTPVPAARADGLGQVVASSVGAGRLVLAGLLAAAVLAAAGLLAVGPDAVTAPVVLRGALAGLAGLAAAAVVVHRAVRQLGGITGDVLGATVEVTFTATLVVLTLLV